MILLTVPSIGVCENTSPKRHPYFRELGRRGVIMLEKNKENSCETKEFFVFNAEIPPVCLFSILTLLGVLCRFLFFVAYPLIDPSWPVPRVRDTAWFIWHLSSTVLVPCDVGVRRRSSPCILVASSCGA